MAETTCGTCCYWDRCDDEQGVAGNGLGECRRHAPTFHPSLGNPTIDPQPVIVDWNPWQVGSWPTTEFDMWCGEWGTRTGIKVSELSGGWKGLNRLHLYGPARRAFVRLKVETVDDVQKLYAADLLAQKGFGEVALRQVREKLAEYGLALAGEQPPLRPCVSARE